MARELSANADNCMIRGMLALDDFVLIKLIAGHSKFNSHSVPLILSNECGDVLLKNIFPAFCLLYLKAEHAFTSRIMRLNIHKFI